MAQRWKLDVDERAPWLVKAAAGAAIGALSYRQQRKQQLAEEAATQPPRPAGPSAAELREKWLRQNRFERPGDQPPEPVQFPPRPDPPPESRLRTLRVRTRRVAERRLRRVRRHATAAWRRARRN